MARVAKVTTRTDFGPVTPTAGPGPQIVDALDAFPGLMPARLRVRAPTREGSEEASKASKFTREIPSMSVSHLITPGPGRLGRVSRHYAHARELDHTGKIRVWKGVRKRRPKRPATPPAAGRGTPPAGGSPAQYIKNIYSRFSILPTATRGRTAAEIVHATRLNSETGTRLTVETPAQSIQRSVPPTMRPRAARRTLRTGYRQSCTCACARARTREGWEKASEASGRGAGKAPRASPMRSVFKPFKRPFSPVMNR